MIQLLHENDLIQAIMLSLEPGMLGGLTSPWALAVDQRLALW
jgi:hypothetical protein